MRVFFAKSQILDFALIQEWMSDMPEGKRSKTERLRKQSDKALSITAHRLLCYALKKEYGIYLSADGWGVGENGKPYLANAPDVHFNISHSVNAVMCAVHNSPVGVDIEIIRAAKDDVARRIMSAEELTRYLESKEKQDLFYKIWTLKEAYMKYSGKGLGEALDAITIYPHEKQIRTNVRDCRFTLLEIMPGYQAAVCADVSAYNTAELIDGCELIEF